MQNQMFHSPPIRSVSITGEHPAAMHHGHATHTTRPPANVLLFLLALLAMLLPQSQQKLRQRMRWKPDIAWWAPVARIVVATPAAVPAAYDRCAQHNSSNSNSTAIESVCQKLQQKQQKLQRQQQQQTEQLNTQQSVLTNT